MMETIVSWFASIVGELLDGLITGFLGLITCDIDVIAGYFPLLVTGYRFFQSIGIGLIIAIAIIQTLKFFAGQLTEVSDTPVRIATGSFIAGAMIWFGGYFLELFVDIARIPFEAFVNMDGSEKGTIPDAFSNILTNFKLFDWGLDGWALNFGPDAVMVAALIIMILIGWNCLKLMLEVCERYLLLGVLVYSAPLVYPTIASNATSFIFKKWVSMFFGQCILMTISAWFMKLVISGFSFTEDTEGVMFRLLLTLALCKIAQRADTYMQQLGIGVGTTGGNLVDDAIGLAAMFRKGRSSSNSSTVLGAGSDGSLSKFGGIVGMTQGAFRKGIQAYKEGYSPKHIASAVKNGAVQGAMGPIGRKAAAVKNERKSSLQSMSQKAVSGQKSFNDRVSANPVKYSKTSGGNPSGAANFANADDSVKASLKDSKLGVEQFMKHNSAVNGAGGFEIDNEGTAKLDQNAQMVGLSWNNNYDETIGENAEKMNQILGPSEHVGNFIAENYNASNPAVQSALIETARNGIPLAAEQALFNSGAPDLSGNDQLGEALVRNAFDVKSITGDDGSGKISNVNAYTVDGNSRVVEFSYTDSNNRESSYKIENYESAHQMAGSKREAIGQFMEGFSGQHKMQQITSNNGANYYTSGYKVKVKK